VTIPASEVHQENGVLEITPSSTNPTITERGMWNIFRTCGRDDQQGKVAGTYILAHFKDKKIAFINDKTTYGKGLADETLKTIKAGGMDAVLNEGINTGEKDYSALISKIKQSGADLVYFGGLYTEAGLIVRQMRDQGVKAPLMAGSESRGRGIPRQEIRAGILHALQLRRRADHRPGRSGGKFDRPEEGRRQDALRHELQHRAR
jgi:branched-chain amino acid transport system substrate-binding protein